MRAKVPLCLGTDGQTRSSILEEARLLEMHERLHVEKRTVLSRAEGDEPARYCLDAATKFGARSLGLETGELAEGLWADLCAFDLDDPHLVGLDDDSLLAGIIYSADSRALTDVMVGGEWVVLMRGHGSVAVGHSLPMAVHRAVFTEISARIQAEALRLGNVTPLTADEAAE